MEITTTQEVLVEKLKVQLNKNLVASLESKELTDEEKQANVTIAQRNINNDANVIANLVFAAFAE